MKLEQVIQGEISPHGRWYGDACGMSMTLEILGERWGLLIVRELMFGARRFSDLRADLPGISARVLTERLVGLAAAGVLQKVTLPAPASAEAYELTEWGLLARPMICEMVKWAMRSPDHDPSLFMSATAFGMTLPMTYDAERAPDCAGLTMGLEIGAHRLVAWVTRKTIAVIRGDTQAQDVLVRGEGGNAMLALFYGKMPPEAWISAAEGRVILGDVTGLQNLIATLQWPEKLAA